MNSTVSRVGTTIRKGFVIAWLAGVGLWALADNKLEGVLSIALLVLVLYVSARLGGWDASRRDTQFNLPRFGPTEKDVDLDPLFKMFSHNIHHNKD